MSRSFAATLAYLAFVVYGSLVPLDFRPIPLDQAWLSFQQVPFLSLGVGSRADWVANGVLYVPLGFLLETANHRYECAFYRGRLRHYWAMPWRGRFIWGATAGMLVTFQRIVGR